MKTHRKIFWLLVAFVALAIPAFGDAVFTMGDHPQPNEQNILFLTDMMGAPGTPIDGHTNITDTIVQYVSTTDTLIGSGGQSDIDAADGLINNIRITASGHSFQDLIINPFKPTSDGDLVVTVITNTGPFHFTYGDIHGDNFLTITTSMGEVIDSVTINSINGFQGLKQTRISGVSAGVIPEPSSMLLLGSGLLAVGVMIRRKLS